jgi:8-oxo-dGTP pyrophosphatase MutT (NUDIX family)
MKMKNYTLILIFSEDKKDILLMHRFQEPCKGLLIGLGGKIENDEYDYRKSAIREVKEEAEIKIDLEKIITYKVMAIDNSLIHVFYTSIKKDTKFNIECKKGSIQWYSINDCLSNKYENLETQMQNLIKSALLVIK